LDLKAPRGPAAGYGPHRTIRDLLRRQVTLVGRRRSRNKARPSARSSIQHAKSNKLKDLNSAMCYHDLDAGAWELENDREDLAPRCINWIDWNRRICDQSN